MAAGAGSIDDMGPLRHGVMGVLFSGTLRSSSPFLLVFCCLPLPLPLPLPSAPVCLSHQIGPLCPQRCRRDQ
jgi:hypothetical protein